ncbi:MAG: mechanosensitive ion channel [Burkholderiales bacterium]|nr:mechanosensitive ion channel [Burkholderiales bacterium]
MLVVGVVVAHFVRGAIRSAAEGVGFEYAKGLGTLVYGALLAIVATLAIGQLDIETKLLNDAISIVLIAVAASVALSLGLGTRDIAGNVIAGVYARDLFKAGATIKFGDVSGKIIEVGTTKTVIQTQGKKRISVANRELITQTVETS